MHKSKLINQTVIDLVFWVSASFFENLMQESALMTL